MRNKRPWFRKAWKNHASGNPRTDTKNKPETDAEIENIPSGTGNDSPDAAAQLFESEAAKQAETAEGEPNAAQQLFENEACETQRETPNAAQRLYAEESARDEKEAKPASRRKYVIAAAMSAAVLLLAAIPATYSYLTASSDTVINTFAGGAISLTLDEADVDTDGNPTDDPRVQENSYKVVPGATLYKDPTVTVLSGSEVCYVYLYVENPLDEDYFTLNYSSDWKVVATTGTKTLYVYKTTVDATDGDVALTPIFTTVTVSDALTSGQIEAMGEVQIKVQAYAVQAQGVDSATSIQMAADYFAEEFGFAWTDVDTGVEIDALTSNEEDDAAADETETVEDSGTSSDTTDEDSSADETDTPDTSASDEASDSTGTSDAGSDNTSSDESSSNDTASDSSDSSGSDAGSDVSTESVDSSGDSSALNIAE